MKLKILLLVSSFVIITFFAFVLSSNPPSYSVMNELRAQGDEIIEKIEEYYKSNKNYPDSLSVIGIDSDKDHYSGWEYTLASDGQTFELSIDDYKEYLFVMSWDSNYSEWYLDQ